jgi:hypothetical protein
VFRHGSFGVLNAEEVGLNLKTFMFNLDQAVANWRKQMMAAGIKSAEDLDELESHLREDLEQQMHAGVTVERAFRETVQRFKPVFMGANKLVSKPPKEPMAMNNFEPDIADWRRRLVDAGIKRSEVLDELEGHLREDIERRVRSDGDVSQLFEKAAAQFGQPQSLKTEFDQIKERKYMKRGMMIGAGIVGVMVGMALVMPAVAQYRIDGAMRNSEPWLFLIGSLITLAGCLAGFRGLKKARV